MTGWDVCGDVTCARMAVACMDDALEQSSRLLDPAAYHHRAMAEGATARDAEDAPREQLIVEDRITAGKILRLNR